MGFLRGKGRACGGVGTSAALAWTLLLASTIGAQGPAQGGGVRSASLTRALAGRPPALELRRRLAGLDPSELPALFSLAASGVVSDETEGQDSTPIAITREERQTVRECLAARPRRELVPFLTDLAARPLEPASRLEAQRLLGNMGTADHLKLLTRLTTPSQERGGIHPELRSGFVAAASAILARDDTALAGISGLFSESPPGLASSIVDAAASQPSTSVTRVLAGLLGRSPGLDPLLLARLGERGLLSRPGNEAVFDSVRRYLRQGDPNLVSAAAMACGKLGDDEAVELLMGLIEHADARVRQSAFGALASLSGLAFGADPARWMSWYHTEMRWWSEEAESKLVLVERGRGLEFTRAAREVLEHRLFRDRMAESFVLALRHESSEETRLACRALEQLRSPIAIRALVECLDRGDLLVREAAWKALRAITGADLPPEADSWAEYAP